MSIKEKWHQFVGTQADTNHLQVNGMDRGHSKSNHLKQPDNSVDVTHLDPAADKQNDEQNKPTLTPNQTSRPSPNLDVGKLKHRFSLKYK